MVSCREAIALATESTRNGMSSLTMPMRMRRLPASPPMDSIERASSPGLRLAASAARNSAAARSASRVRPWVSPGIAFPVSAFLIDSTKGGSKRRWAVMYEMFSEAIVGCRGPPRLALRGNHRLEPARLLFDEPLELSRRQRLTLRERQSGGKFGQPRLVVIDPEDELDDRGHRRTRLRLDPRFLEQLGIFLG